MEGECLYVSWLTKIRAEYTKKKTDGCTHPQVGWGGGPTNLNLNKFSFLLFVFLWLRFRHSNSWRSLSLAYVISYQREKCCPIRPSRWRIFFTRLLLSHEGWIISPCSQNKDSVEIDIKILPPFNDPPNIYNSNGRLGPIVKSFCSTLIVSRTRGEV